MDHIRSEYDGLAGIHHPPANFDRAKIGLPEEDIFLAALRDADHSPYAVVMYRRLAVGRLGKANDE